MTPEEVQALDWILRFVDAGVSTALLIVMLSLFYTGRIVSRQVMEAIINAVTLPLIAKIDAASAEIKAATVQIADVAEKMNRRGDGWR
jgi:hypothetical protein